MSHYNPDEPFILGNQWVPIDAGQTGVDTITETGTTFRLDTNMTVVSGGVYIPVQYPMQVVNGGISYVGMNVYPKGLEDLSGPIEQRIYTAQGGVVSGDMQVNGSCTITQALQNNGACGIISTGFIDPDDADGFLDVNFAINSAGELNGKRILKVEVLYSANFNPPFEGFEDRDFPGQVMVSSNVKNVEIDIFKTSLNSFDPNFIIVDIGEWNRDFPEDVPLGSGIQGDFMFPWTPATLNRFDSATATAQRLAIRWTVGDLQQTIWWVAMRVTYCDERRIALGAHRMRSANTPGTKMIQLRPAATLASGGVPLTPGEYTVTHNAFDTGEAFVSPPRTSWARQLYEIPDHQGVVVHRRFIPGQQLEKEITNVLPQLSLHTTTTALTGVHGYGTQVAAQVDASTVAAQDIQNPVSAGLVTPVSMTQVRYYARKQPETKKSLFIQGDVANAVITSDEFDLLPEIWDGWKEVTLRLNTAAIFQVTGGAQVWTWTSNGQDTGSSWEVLGATANTADPVSPPVLAPLEITGTTYGRNTRRMWHGFWDDFADAALLFSSDPAIPSNFALAEQEQTLRGVDTTCPGVDLTCIPSSLRYHQLSWTATGLRDTFDVPLTDTWGSKWTITGGATADYDVAGGFGTVALPVADTSHFAVGASTMYDVDVQTTFKTNQLAVTSAIRFSVVFRYVDPNNYYEARVLMNTTTSMQVGIFKVVAGTATFIGGTSDVTVSGVTHAVNVVYGLHVRTSGPVVYMSLWNATNSDEPTLWSLTAIDNVSPPIGKAGFRIRTAPSNTNSGLIVSVGHAYIDDLDSGGYEIQRQDNIDTDWMTIMRSDSSFASAFADYEPRVGVQSRYRLRKANVMDFWSDWTATLSNTLSSPGVDVAGDGNSVLILSTNWDQTGAKNLAATMSFKSDAEEPFAFIESGDTTFSQMFGRDYQLAAHPTERGGEKFTRNIIVQQAAIALPSLGNFRTLRDMAWQAAPYVCVRDELGNRWLANVQVPDGTVSRNRRLYIASITITEVTATPAIIDPEA
jgi:hypothetical protein